MPLMRFPDCSPCCCDDIADLCPSAFHRDLEETIGDSRIDARELLWNKKDGWSNGEFTTENVEWNCTLDDTIASSTTSYDDTPGSISAKLTVTPTESSFTGLKIIWGNAVTFEPWSHETHQAHGELQMLWDYRHGHDNDDFDVWALVPSVGATTPAAIAGLVVEYVNESSETVRLYKMNPLTFDGQTNNCWKYVSPETNWHTIDDDGIFVRATTAQLIDAGLDGTPLSVSRTLTVGVAIGVSSTWADKQAYAGDVAETYYSSTILDNLCVSGVYTIKCVAAFHQHTTLTAQFGEAHVGTSNIEPVEIRGVVVPLTLTAADQITDPETMFLGKLYQVALAGYAYYGLTEDAMTTRSGIHCNVEVYYIPCSRVIIKITEYNPPDPGNLPCPSIWVVIFHQSALSDPGSINGHYHPPSFSGFELRDRFGKLDTSYYGADCLDTTLNNLTDCYSLNPIAIGYVCNVSDQYGFPFVTTCALAPCVDELPVAQRSRYCGGTLFRTSAFTAGLQGFSAVDYDHVHFFVDITE